MFACKLLAATGSRIKATGKRKNIVKLTVLEGKVAEGTVQLQRERNSYRGKLWMAAAPLPPQRLFTRVAAVYCVFAAHQHQHLPLPFSLLQGYHMLHQPAAMATASHPATAQQQ
jgi:hypothetical protein